LATTSRSPAPPSAPGASTTCPTLRHGLVAALEPAAAQIVIVKSHIQFRAGYDGIAKEIILLDSPGMSGDHLAILSWERIE
jgi:microcystin degradation protein MlrC